MLVVVDSMTRITRFQCISFHAVMSERILPQIASRSCQSLGPLNHVRCDSSGNLALLLLSLNIVYMVYVDFGRATSTPRLVAELNTILLDYLEGALFDQDHLLEPLSDRAWHRL